MKNYAGQSGEGLDTALLDELNEAGAGHFKLPESFRDSAGEVKTLVHGSLYGWTFDRAWYYWIVKGPGIPIDKAMQLQEAHGKVVRANGDCACRGPLFWNRGFPTTMYHVDTQEGLNALVSVIKRIYAEALPSILLDELTEAANEFERITMDSCKSFEGDDRKANYLEAIASDAMQRIDRRLEEMPEEAKALSHHKQLVAARDLFKMIAVDKYKEDTSPMVRLNVYCQKAKAQAALIRDCL